MSFDILANSGLLNTKTTNTAGNANSYQRNPFTTTVNLHPEDVKLIRRLSPK